MAFTRWDPFRDLLMLDAQLGRLAGADAPGWTPPVDLYETSAAFMLTAEIPGVSREQIEIHTEAYQVVIRGERGGADMSCQEYHRVERGHGRFSRAFTLPAPIDTDAVTAELKDGVLTVTLPKAGGHSARRPR